MRTRSRQLNSVANSIDTAIVLLLAGFYPDAICRVAAAAHKKLATHGHGRGAEESRLTLLRKRAADFLATADLSLGAEVSDEELDHLLFLDSLQLDALDYPLTVNMQTFRIWFFALYPSLASADQASEAKFVFPGLTALPRNEQLRRGEELLRRMTDHRGTSHVA